MQRFIIRCIGNVCHDRIFLTAIMACNFLHLGWEIEGLRRLMDDLQADAAAAQNELAIARNDNAIAEMQQAALSNEADAVKGERDALAHQVTQVPVLASILCCEIAMLQDKLFYAKSRQ